MSRGGGSTGGGWPSTTGNPSGGGRDNNWGDDDSDDCGGLTTDSLSSWSLEPRGEHYTAYVGRPKKERPSLALSLLFAPKKRNP